MIDSLKLNEVRTVYDTQNPKIGSIVSDAVEEKDSDTLFPLQAALGYNNCPKFVCFAQKSFGRRNL